MSKEVEITEINGKIGIKADNIDWQFKDSKGWYRIKPIYAKQNKYKPMSRVLEDFFNIQWWDKLIGYDGTDENE